MDQGGFAMKLGRSAGLLTALGFVFGAGGALAQNLISAKAGVVHLAEGDVFLNGEAIHPKVTEFPSIKEGGLLRTGDGRAEVLLAPGGFLRMAEESEFRMVSTRLSDIRLDVTRGAVLIEVADLLQENNLTVTLRDSSVTLRKTGLYRFDVDAGSLRVYEGEAVAEVKGQRWVLKGSRGLVASAGGWTTEKFDSETGDALYRWSKRRSSYLSMANVSSARTIGSYGYYGGRLGGGWIFNPWMGMMTFVPMYGTLYSPFGYAYYSPQTVYQVIYYPYPTYSGGGSRGSRPSAGFDNSIPSTQSPRGYDSGYSAPVVSSGSSSATAAPAPSRGGADAGGRGPSTGGGGGGGGRRQ